MIITFLTKDRIWTLALPKRVTGSYWINDTDSRGKNRKAINIEGIQGRWRIYSNARLSLLENDRDIEFLELEDKVQVINARNAETGELVQIFAEPSTDDRRAFHKYYVKNACTLRIGRLEKNDIVFENKYTSGEHAILAYQSGKWSIKDTNSSNGTFVNDVRVDEKRLTPGDVVYIMGLKIILGKDFFAVNDPDGSVTLKPGISAIAAMEDERTRIIMQNRAGTERTSFSRSPRFHPEIVRETIRIDAPPPLQNPDGTPLGLMIGPAITMGMTAMAMGGTAAANLAAGSATLASALPTFVMTFSMLCGTLLWPMLTKRHDKKEKKKAEQLRRDKYGNYLSEIRGKLFELGEKQRGVLEENYPNADECARRISARDDGLWERSAEDKNFLRMRMGVGRLPIAGDFIFPENRFSIGDDLLQNDLARLAEEPKVIDDAPIVFLLSDNSILGIAGEKGEYTAYLKNLLLQLAALHGDSELKLMFVGNDTDEDDWEFLKILPHIWSENREMRYFAKGEDEGKTLAVELDRLIAEWAEQRENKDRVHYVFVVTDKDIAVKYSVFEKIARCKKSHIS